MKGEMWCKKETSKTEINAYLPQVRRESPAEAVRIPLRSFWIGGGSLEPGTSGPRRGSQGESTVFWGGRRRRPYSER